jgi:type I restriction enzyme S subunit
MSEEATLEDFQDKSGGDQKQDWRKVKLGKVSWKRSENVDPQEVDIDRHVGLEHIESNNPSPSWEPINDLSSTKRRFNSGDILFAKLRPNLEKSAQPNFEGVSSTDIFPIVAEEGVNSKYLLYRLSSKPAFDYARRTSAGTRMPRTSWNLFSNFEFDLPSLVEQRKIATVLYTVERAIEKTRKIIERKERIRTGLLQDMFTGVDPDSTKSVRLSAVDADIPEHWEVKTVDEVSTQITDGAHLTPDRSEEGYLLLSARNVKNGFLDLSDVDYVPEAEYERLIEKCNPQPGDILISCSGTVGRVCEVPENLEFALVRSAALVKFDNSILPSYAEKVLQSIGVQKQIKGYQTQSAQPNLFQGQIASLEIPIPPAEEQRQIAKKLDDVSESISSEQQYKSQLIRLKRGLQQDLLSGKVRTTDTNIQVPNKISQHG